MTIFRKLKSILGRKREAEIRQRVRQELEAMALAERERAVANQLEGERMLEAYRKKQAVHSADEQLTVISGFFADNINRFLERHPWLTRDMILAELFRQLSEGSIAA